MAKPLSAQLADLSVRAKNAEGAVASAQKEGHDEVEVLAAVVVVDAGVRVGTGRLAHDDENALEEVRGVAGLRRRELPLRHLDERRLVTERPEEPGVDDLDLVIARHRRAVLPLLDRERSVRQLGNHHLAAEPAAE